MAWVVRCNTFWGDGTMGVVVTVLSSVLGVVVAMRRRCGRGAGTGTGGALKAALAFDIRCKRLLGAGGDRGGAAEVATSILSPVEEEIRCMKPGTSSDTSF